MTRPKILASVSLVLGSSLALGACSFIKDFDDFSASCPAGTADCDPMADACETPVTDDPQNCGACGNVCAPGDFCAASSCQRYSGTGGFSYDVVNSVADTPKIAAASNGGIFVAANHSYPLTVLGTTLPATDWNGSVFRVNRYGDLNFAVSLTGPLYDDLTDLQQTSFGVVASARFRSIAIDLGSAVGAGAHLTNTDNTGATMDGVLWAMNEDGTYRWHIQAKGTGDTSFVAVTTDGQGNVYAAGTFAGTDLRFGDVATPRNEGLAAGVFIAKFLANGAYAWSKAINVTNPFVLGSIQADAAGNVYVFSTSAGSMTIGGTTVTSASSIPRVFALDANGQVLWFQGYAGAEPSADAGDSLDIIPSASGDRVFIAFLSGNASSAIGSIQVRKGAIVAEIDKANGTPLQAFVVSEDANPYGLAHDAEGNLVLGLYVNDGSLTEVDLLGRNYPYTSFGTRDSLVVGLTTSGALTHFRHFGSSGSEYPRDIATNSENQIYVSLALPAQFDLDDTHLVPVAPNPNAMVLRLAPRAVPGQ